MKTHIAQIKGMAYYEFRMLWRERSLLVITLALLVMALVTSWIAVSEIVEKSDSAFDILVDAQVAVARIIVFLIWGPIGVSLALLLPIFMADLIPKDQQIGARELLDTLPMPRGVYLTGKLLGGWLAMCSSLLILMVTIAALWWVRAGAFDFRTYLEMWLWGALPLVIINGGLGILLPSTQPTRRRAILLMIGVSIVSTFVTIGDMELNPVSLLRGPMLFYFMNVDFDVSPQLFLQTLLIGLVQLLIVVAAVWGWLRWRETGR